MEISVPIYQQKLGASLYWTTVGLGAYTEAVSGRSPIKLQQQLVERLKKVFSEIDPPMLEIFEAARGVRLVRLRLDLDLRGERGRRKVTGKFPLIIEPRWANAEQRLFVAYHPDRQDPLEWFPVDSERVLAEQASLYFSRTWAELDADDFDLLETDGKDRLRFIAFDGRPRSVLEKLPEREKGIWDDLYADPRREKGKRKRKRRKKLKVLDELGVDQTARVAEGTVGQGMPRTPYRQQLQLLLGGSRRSPVLLVGPPGVGKTTILQRFIADQLEADDFASHRNLDRVTHVWSVAGKRLIAGMSYLGDWEKRVIDLCDDASQERVVLWIEDVHAWGRLGRSRDSERNLAELLRGPLARGEMLVIGECTPEQLSRLEDDAPSFAALFTQIHVSETSAADTLRMMMHEARALELRHELSFSPFVFRTLLELGSSLFPGSALPGKALDLLREMARHAHDRLLDPVEVAHFASMDPQAATELDPGHVVQLLSLKTGLPELLLEPDSTLTRERVEQQLGRAVIGQPVAVRAASDLVMRIRAGLSAPGRPYAVYLITGPTGTGKTELAKSLAEYLYGDRERLVRFDMGELSGPDAPARLIGDRFSPRGLLTDAVRLQPFSVLLLDEIEKAHRSVFHLLLQLFDEGRLTDAAGETADFTHSVVLMTSNLGARAKASLGFGDDGQHATAEIKRAIESFFAPELFNRIDRVVPFTPLSKEAARGIAEKELAALLGRWGLAERNIFVYVGEAAIARVVSDGFDATYGARTVKRYLERHIGAKLTAAITESAPAAMRILRVFDRGDGELGLHDEVLAEADAEVAPYAIADLLDKPPLELKAMLPETLDALDALLGDDRVEALGRDLSAMVEAHNRGEEGAADHAYRLEAMRETLRSLRRRVGYHNARKSPDRDQVLACLAEVEFYKRALAHIDDPEQHTIFLVLGAVGLGRADARRFSDVDVSLMSSMARAAANDRRRAELEGFAFRLRDDTIGGRSRRPDDGVDLAAELERAVARGVDLVVLRLSGIAVRDYFAGERGCHIWRSLAHGTEVVRVDLLSAPDGKRAREVAEEHVAAVRAFNEALERGGDLPHNPEGLLPAVRQFRFTPPATRGARAPCEIEDYHLAHVETVRIADIAEALPRLWTLRMSRTHS
ncbi:MAG: ATP-dependent Clp protease ATP-binding subunit [Myxococcales bacterium]|nr:ATP-dependent Clp protease ATP-binding subunit [Myxococcales bacterium]